MLIQKYRCNACTYIHTCNIRCSAPVYICTCMYKQIRVHLHILHLCTYILHGTLMKRGGVGRDESRSPPLSHSESAVFMNGIAFSANDFDKKDLFNNLKHHNDFVQFNTIWCMKIQVCPTVFSFIFVTRPPFLTASASMQSDGTDQCQSPT
jgi:hypothetical protein